MSGILPLFLYFNCCFCTSGAIASHIQAVFKALLREVV